MTEEATTLAAEAKADASLTPGDSFVTTMLATSHGRRVAELAAVGLEAIVQVEKTSKGTRIRAHHVYLKPAQAGTFAAMIAEAGKIAARWEAGEV